MFDLRGIAFQRTGDQILVLEVPAAGRGLRRILQFLRAGRDHDECKHLAFHAIEREMRPEFVEAIAQGRGPLGQAGGDAFQHRAQALAHISRVAPDAFRIQTDEQAQILIHAHAVLAELPIAPAVEKQAAGPEPGKVLDARRRIALVTEIELDMRHGRLPPHVERLPAYGYMRQNMSHARYGAHKWKRCCATGHCCARFRASPGRRMPGA
ncbi:MAG: hypothetical protein ACOCP9_05630 [Halofilum sp. (in: g-proteobacteria)]